MIPLTNHHRPGEVIVKSSYFTQNILPSNKVSAFSWCMICLINIQVHSWMCRNIVSSVCWYIFPRLLFLHACVCIYAYTHILHHITTFSNSIVSLLYFIDMSITMFISHWIDVKINRNKWYIVIVFAATTGKPSRVLSYWLCWSWKQITTIHHNPGVYIHINMYIYIYIYIYICNYVYIDMCTLSTIILGETTIRRMSCWQYFQDLSNNNLIQQMLICQIICLNVLWFVEQRCW